MALRSTVYRCALDVANVDLGYYAAHDLTLARHPSETEARLMLRVLAFALHATDAMEFGRGLSSEDEPDLWDRDETGRIRHWIMLGLPDERRLRRAAGRSDRVTLITYGERALKP
ncbi:MAG: YaeQ family protein, partial [Pseudomonadales bacterium]